MSLPKPSYSFTIPSIQDDTPLDCRLYHPTLKQRKAATSTTLSAAIIAHPYAPLGGSQDDPVVSTIGSILLKHDFLVGTFNFRGAAGSAGKTSWSARLELADYVSFYGYMLAYLNSINSAQPLLDGATHPLAAAGTLILGGYSYGSLITKCLPPLSVVAAIFASPAPGSAQAEIILRAQDISKDHLEKQQICERPARGRHSLRLSAGLVVGGNESEETNRRISRDSSRRSLDLEGVRRSVDRIRKRSSRRVSERHDLGHNSRTEVFQASNYTPSIGYLLVSPLLAPVTAFLSFSSKPKLPASLTQGIENAPTKDQLLLHPTCCVFGHHDIFTSHHRIQKWSEKLRQMSESKFSSYSVEQAGHFWQEEGAESGLRDALEGWICELQDGAHENSQLRIS